MLRALVDDGADLVNASRTRRRPTAMPFVNYVGNRVFAGVAAALHGVRSTDLHSGMRAYRTSMLRALDLDSDGAALPVSLLVAPARMGFRIVDVEIPYRARVGFSTLHKWESSVWTLRRLGRGGPGERVRRKRWTTL